jgi:two-component system, cell cycle sensor histidine kinase and response regulator CckA
MIERILFVASRNQDQLASQRGRVLALALIVLTGLDLLIGVISLVRIDGQGLLITVLSVAINLIIFLVNRSGRVSLAVNLLLISMTAIIIFAMLLIRSPTPMFFFLGLIVVVASAFGNTHSGLLWAGILSLLPLLINQQLYGSLVAPRSPILLPDGTRLSSIFIQELFAVVLMWMLAGASFFASRLLKDTLQQALDAAARSAADNEALRRSEERFARFFHVNPIGSSLRRISDDRFLDVNASYAELLGYSRPELIGRTADELGFRMDEALYQEAIADVLSGQGARDLELTFRQRSGATRIASVSIEPIELDGEPCILVMASDITERKRAEAQLRENEERLRLIADNTSDLIALFDDESRFVYASPSHQNVLGYSPEELLGQSGGAFTHPEDLKLMAGTAMALRSGEALQLIIRFRHANGEWRWLEASANSLRWNGEIYSILVGRDITERRTLELQLIQSQKMESVGRLAGGVAHDFNNLLTAIIGFADLAIAALPSMHPAHADLLEIQRATERAATLTRQLLVFARRQAMDPQFVNVNSLIADSERLLRQMAGPMIELVLQYAPDLNAIRADIGQIEQVLVNLVVNARDAMPAGGTILIETTNITMDTGQTYRRVGTRLGAYVQITVHDTGTGMSREVLAHLFEPFFTTKAPGKGTGLGLAICYGIIRQHGGHIEIVSDVGLGTHVSIYLPQALSTAPAPPPPSIARVLPTGNEVIVLSETDTVVRNLTTRVLRDLGYIVLPIETSEQALQLAGEQRIDLLLTDSITEEEGAQPLIDLLTASNPDLRIIYTSGYTDPAGAQSGSMADVSFLPKPYTPSELAAKLREVLDSRSGE